MSRLGYGFLIGWVGLAGILLVSAKDKRLNTKEFLEKHLASIGAPQSRANRTSIRAIGDGQLRVLVGAERKLEGRAELVSDGSSFRSSLVFDVSDYPSEEISFDGRKTYVNQLNPGQRSLIGNFIYLYEELLTEGLLGGTLSTGWSLLNFDRLKPNLKHEGLRKFGTAQLHEVRYRRKKGRQDVNVRLYFLPDTFHHVASVYRLEVPPSLPEFTLGSSAGARAAQSSSQVGTRVTLEEYFSDFRPVGGLALPFHWKVRLTGEGPEAELAALGFGGASRELAVLEWDIQFEKVDLNVDLDAGEFKLY